MSRKSTALLSVAGAAVLALGVSTALVAPAGAAPDESFDLAVGNTPVVRTDVGAPGVSIGDEYVYADRLFRDGREVGQDGSSCQVTRMDGPVTSNCVLSVQLPDGQLIAQSLWVQGSDTVRMAVTGGTGAYLGVVGELVATDIQTPHETYHVRLIRR